MQFGTADALIIYGSTFDETLSRISEIRQTLPEAKIIIGAGVKHVNISEALKHADGVIVGSSALEEQPYKGPISLRKSQEFVQLARE
jgi:predicted TIM-barrel enzyme